MIYGAAKLLTLLGVLIHAGMGCCAHHDHCSALQAAPSAVERQESNESHQCSCSVHADCQADAAGKNAGKDEPDHSSCPCGEGHGGCSDHCSWLTNSKVELPTNDGMVLPAAIADVWSVHTANTALIAGRSADCSPRLSDATDTLRAKTQIWRL